MVEKKTTEAKKKENEPIVIDWPPKKERKQTVFMHNYKFVHEGKEYTVQTIVHKGGKDFILAAHTMFEIYQMHQNYPVCRRWQRYR